VGEWVNIESNRHASSKYFSMVPCRRCITKCKKQLTVLSTTMDDWRFATVIRDDGIPGDMWREDAFALAAMAVSNINTEDWMRTCKRQRLRNTPCTCYVSHRKSPLRASRRRCHCDQTKS
jgi:hypothetical protein